MQSTMYRVQGKMYKVQGKMYKVQGKMYKVQGTRYLHGKGGGNELYQLIAPVFLHIPQNFFLHIIKDPGPLNFKNSILSLLTTFQGLRLRYKTIINSHAWVRK